MSSTTKQSIAFLDFDSIKASLRDFLRSQTIFKDYNFEGAGLSILLDLLSYNTHYFGFYLNMIANEMFLDSASLRSSVVSLAKQLGYTTRSITSATATVSIAITPNDNTASAVIATGTMFTTTVNGVNYNFVTNQAYGATIQNGQYLFPSVTLVEGIPYTFRITVNSAIVGQRFIIPSSTVDTSTLIVSVQSSITDTTTQAFSLATNLVQITSTSTVYFLQEVENQQYEVYFGDGVIGQALEDGNIVILEYIVSDGTAPNGALTFTPVSTVAGYQKYLTTTTTLTAAAGGKDAQTIDEIKFIAPKTYEVQGRAVTAGDYSIILQNSYSNLDSVAVWGGEDMTPPQYGKVFISIKPVQGFVVTQTAKDLVISNLLRTVNIVSVIPEIIDPVYIYIIVNCTVKFDPTVTSNTVGEIYNEAYNAILNYAQIELDKFNLEFRYSKLLAAIDNSDTSIITSDLTTIQMKQIFQPNLQVVSNYQILMNNPVIPGTVSSSSFVTVNDPLLQSPYVNGKTYTIGDDGLGNLTMIQHGIGIPNSVVRQCGTINYTTGDILLQQIIPTQADINGNISIIMTPAQNDIEPLRNNILYILPTDINVTALAITPISN